MIRTLARTFKTSDFNAVLAYVFILNLLWAGFAQSAMAVEMIQSGEVICSSSNITYQTGPGQNGSDACTMCCIAAPNDNGLQPNGVVVTGRMAIINQVLFAAGERASNASVYSSRKARAPPLG